MTGKRGADAPNDRAEVVLSRSDSKAIDIITQLKGMRVNPKVSTADQMVLKGGVYTVVGLFITVAIALFVTGSILITLLGDRYQIRMNLLVGFALAFLLSATVFALSMFIISIRRQKDKDPLAEANLKARFGYENECAQKLIAEQRPTPKELERAALYLKGQAGRYASYTGARNEYLRGFKDLLLAALLVLGLSAETAPNDWMHPVKSVGAGALILGMAFGQYASAKLYKYQFWLSIIELTQYLMKSEIDSNNKEEKEKI